MVESRQKPAKLRSNYMVKVIYRSAFARVTKGDTMGRADILRAIKKSEDGAKKIQSDAEAKAAETLSNARVKAAESTNSGRQGADDEAAKMLSDARAAAEKEAESVAAEGEAELERVANEGKKNRSTAADAVLDTFRKN